MARQAVGAGLLTPGECSPYDGGRAAASTSFAIICVLRPDWWCPAGISTARTCVAFQPQAGADRFRTRVRTAETAKYLRAVHAENGCEARADHYYVVERRQRRRALRGSPVAWIRRTQDYLLGDLLWRYGSNVARPILALLILALAASAATYLSAGDGATGLHPAPGQPAYGFHGWTARSLTDYLNVLYFFATSVVGGSQAEPAGWAKAVFAGYVLTAIWLIALIFEVSARRLGRSK